MKIGNVEIKGKTVLAPMAGVNNTSFRLLCKKYGCSLTYTQMYDVSVVIIKKNNLKEFFNIKPEERPIAIQLIGNVDDDWKQAVELVKNHCDIIDINLGCGLDDYLEEKKGSYLLKHQDQIKKIVSECVEATSKPITCKIRKGWEKDNSVSVGKLLESLGVKAISIHPRLKIEKYGGKADLDCIKKLKEELTIPVIGNGDITLPGNAKSMMERTKCDLVMIGRAAKNNPSIFEPIEYILKEGKNMDYEINPKKLMEEYIELYQKYENRDSLNELQEHLTWILKNIRSGPNYKEDILNAESVEELKEIISLV